MTSGPGESTHYWLIDQSTQTRCEVQRTSTVGRENCDLIFKKHTSLSRCHFRIIIDDEGAWIEDVGSSNGTKLNGVDLETRVPHPLKSGDVILAGRSEFLFQEGQREVAREPAVEQSSFSAESPSGMHRPLKEKIIGPSETSEPQIQVMLVKPYQSRSTRHRHSRAGTEFSKNGDSGIAYGWKTGRIHPQWVTFLFALGLIAVLAYELWSMQNSPHVAPHTSAELVRRYLGSVGLTYLVMLGVQALLVQFFARRCWVAIGLMLVSVLSGSLTSVELEKRFKYREAQIENKSHSMRVKIEHERRDRAPAKARTPSH
jgi:hypothetical protein